MKNQAKSYFETRFKEDPKRKIVWNILTNYFQKKLISPSDNVLEIGPGYGFFINQVITLPVKPFAKQMLFVFEKTDK